MCSCGAGVEGSEGARKFVRKLGRSPRSFLRFNRQGALAALEWDAPADAPGAPPRNLTARLLAAGGGMATPGVGPMGVEGVREQVLCYNVYRADTPDVPVDPGNLYVSVPPTQTGATVPVAPGGSFFVITACYEGGESEPSNEVGTGTPGAEITSVAVKPAKIVAKGIGFTDVVEVYVDGVRFSSPATVKKRKKVVQKGTLVTGETIGEYFAPGRTVEVTFVNSDGTVTRRMVTR